MLRIIGKIMKTTIICGLLGSGKTSFIRNYLKGRTEKTVVLVNDFGQAGIDGEILSAGGIDSIELPSGCVCCTLKFDLITTIKRVNARYSPEHLLIEPSGVASPAGVLEALESASAGPAAVVGIVDAAEFLELFDSGMYGSFFREQIELSDVVLVNKVDLADEKTILAVERTVTALNPRAVIARTVQAVITEALPAAASRPTASLQNVHCRFDTLSFRIPNGQELVPFSRAFIDLAQGKFGSVARAKALVQTSDGPYRLDSTFGKVDCERFGMTVANSRLVVIGSGLDRTAIERALRAT